MGYERQIYFVTFFFPVYLGVNSREVHYLNEDLARYTGLSAETVHAESTKVFAQKRMRLDIVPVKKSEGEK